MKTEDEKATEMVAVFKPFSEMDKWRLGEYRFGKWTIHCDPPPIPDRNHDWQYVHDDYDGAPDSNDSRFGACDSIEKCLSEIMTDEQQNAEIAKACGWIAVKHDLLVARKIHTNPPHWLVGISPYVQKLENGKDELKSYNYWIVPDYVKDLNAMAEAEKSEFITANAMTYLNRLEAITGTQGAMTQQWKFACASSRKRAAAILLML